MLEKAGAYSTCARNTVLSNRKTMVTAIEWMLCPPKFICWSPMLTVMVIGGGVFHRWVAHEGRAHMNQISTHMEEITESFLSSSDMWGYRKMNLLWTRKWAITRQWFCHCLDLELPSLKNWEMNVCCLNHPFYGGSLRQFQQFQIQTPPSESNYLM